MTSISSSCSSSSSSFSSSKSSKNTINSVSPLTNFINENYNQQQFSEIPKSEENRNNSIIDNQQNASSQITQQQLQMLELLTKAGLLPNSLPNKQEGNF